MESLPDPAMMPGYMRAVAVGIAQGGVGVKELRVNATLPCRSATFAMPLSITATPTPAPFTL